MRLLDFLRQELSIVIHSPLNEELLLTLSRLVVDDKMMVVLEPIKVFVLGRFLVDVVALFGLLLLDALEEAAVGRVVRQVPLVQLFTGKVDVSWCIPLTFEVHPLERQSRFCVGYAHHAHVQLVGLAAYEQAVGVTALLG